MRPIVALAALTLTPWSALPAAAPAAVRSGSAYLPGSVRSVLDIRRSGVVMQAYDYSCGAAALATLLTYGLADRTDEDWVLREVLQSATAGERDALTKKGLSLLDMQRVAEKRGHRAQGFRVGADQLTKLSRPVIVFVRPNGYEHFVVLKGLRGDRVLLADPAQGNVRMPLYRFLAMWADDDGRGIVFAVEPGSGIWPATFPLLTTEAGDAFIALGARQLLEVARHYRPEQPNVINFNR